VKTNIKVVVSRVWGPKLLNFNALLHQKILSTKHGATERGLTKDPEP